MRSANALYSAILDPSGRIEPSVQVIGLLPDAYDDNFEKVSTDVTASNVANGFRRLVG